jgi:hypothetical protein
MKNYLSFINERIYYNSHGVYAPFSEIRELEVEERENYPKETFDEWQKKYKIKDNDLCIWVTPSERQALTYLLDAESHDIIMNMSEEEEKWGDSVELDLELAEIDDKDGFIIPESNDGDNGFLFVKR